MSEHEKTVRQIAGDYADAWCSLEPGNVTAFYAQDGEIVINAGDPVRGQAALKEMVAGFYAEFPDLKVYCDDIRVSGSHAIFIWTLEGHHAETKNHVKVGGWEEWDLDENLKVKASRGWFNAEDYDRQVAEGSG